MSVFMNTDYSDWSKDNLIKEIMELIGYVKDWQKMVEDKSSQIHELHCELEKFDNENKSSKAQCECLKKEAKDLRSADVELIDEPIRIAEKLIYATRKYQLSPIEKAFGCNKDAVDIGVYNKSDLRQIAKHLLVYCNGAEDEA